MAKLKMETKKKEWKTLEIEVEMPQGVTAIYETGAIKVKGPKGEISKILMYPNVYVKVENNIIKVGTKKFTQREKKIIFTYRAHLKNLIKGVTEGFTYKLAVVYSKFPITTQLNGSIFTVKNLLGEKVPRTVEIYNDVKVVVSGKEITITGIDKEKVGQTAASLEQLTRINHFDRRVIQDGIFITEKPHVRYS